MGPRSDDDDLKESVEGALGRLNWVDVARLLTDKRIASGMLPEAITPAACQRLLQHMPLTTISLIVEATNASARDIPVTSNQPRKRLRADEDSSDDSSEDGSDDGSDEVEINDPKHCTKHPTYNSNRCRYCLQRKTVYTCSNCSKPKPVKKRKDVGYLSGCEKMQQTGYMHFCKGQCFARHACGSVKQRRPKGYRNVVV